ncbi:hypothetical protein LZ30DRAFT_710688 [Colletotrichum cereale]|nr:hypothetical protein LZ30DRAFT_710688 [Colletotrichum cereale]
MSNPENYTVGWICAITTEFVAIQAFLDERHDKPARLAPEKCLSSPENNSGPQQSRLQAAIATCVPISVRIPARDSFKRQVVTSTA